MNTGNAIKIILAGVPQPFADSLCTLIEEDPRFGVTATALNLPKDGKGELSIEFYCSATTRLEEVREHLSSLADGAIAKLVEVRLETVEQRDWVAQSQAMLSPIRAGRFYVHGSHDRPSRPVNAIALEIEAAQAFGTGHHGTTKGCLLALDRELKRRKPRRVLDLGCGSGVLALAAALATRTQAVAGDIDPVAVRVARENAAGNGLQSYVRFCEAAGTQHRLIRQKAPYDIVFANILARPLIALAPQIKSVLAKGGRAILSGLTPDQAAAVISAYRCQDLPLVRHSVLDGWSTLVVKR